MLKPSIDNSIILYIKGLQFLLYNESSYQIVCWTLLSSVNFKQENVAKDTFLVWLKYIGWNSLIAVIIDLIILRQDNPLSLSTINQA